VGQKNPDNPLVSGENNDNNDNNDNLLNPKQIHQSTNQPFHQSTNRALCELTVGNQPFNYSTILPLLVVLTSAAIVLTSKGNTGRMWHFPSGGDVLVALQVAALSTGKLLGVLLQQMPLWLAGLLLLPHLSPEALRPSLRPLATLNPLLVAAIALITLFGAMLVPAWAMGINPPLRIYNYLALYFMGFFFWGLMSLHAWLRRKEISLYPAFTGFGRAALVLLIFVAMAGDFHKQPTPFGPPVDRAKLFTYRGNLPRVTSDLLLRAKPYNQAMQQRQEFAEQQKAQGNTHIVLEPLQNPPSSILFLDITSDPEHWINMLQAECFGVESIKARRQGSEEAR
jgi:hypothetical protein